MLKDLTFLKEIILSRNGLLFSFLILLRFLVLLKIPIFGDEGLYLQLGNQFIQNPFTFLNSLPFGVMPIVVIFTGIAEGLSQITRLNPLFLMRGEMIIADLISTWLLYKIAITIWNHKIGLIAAIIYLLLPMTFFHSRLVLLESLTNLFAITSLYFATQLFIDHQHNQSFKPKLVFLSTIFFLLSYFTKPLAFVYFPALLLLPLLAFAKFKFSLKKSKYLVLNSLLLFGGIGLLLIILYLPIAAEFNRHVATSNSSFSDLIINFKQNLWRLRWWSQTYFTVPILLLSFGGFILGLFKKELTVFWLILWIGGVIIMDTFFSAHFYPRHLYPLSVPLVLLSSYLLVTISQKNQFLFRVLFFLSLLPSCFFITNLLQHPQKAAIALEDHQQFFEDWTAGVGFQEVVSKLNQESINKKIVVFVDDQVNEKYVFTRIYPLKNAEIVISKNLQQHQFIEEDLLRKYSGQKKYLILNRNPEADPNWPVNEYFSYPKGNNREIKVYEMRSQN